MILVSWATYCQETTTIYRPTTNAKYHLEHHGSRAILQESLSKSGRRIHWVMLLHVEGASRAYFHAAMLVEADTTLSHTLLRPILVG